jgi:hypothetical protein
VALLPEKISRQRDARFSLYGILKNARSSLDGILKNFKAVGCSVWFGWRFEKLWGHTPLVWCFSDRRGGALLPEKISRQRDARFSLDGILKNFKEVGCSVWFGWRFKKLWGHTSSVWCFSDRRGGALLPEKFQGRARDARFSLDGILKNS